MGTRSLEWAPHTEPAGQKQKMESVDSQTYCVFGTKTEIGREAMGVQREALDAYISAAPICSHGAKMDHSSFTGLTLYNYPILK